MQLFLLLNLHEILKIYMDFSGKIWYNPLVAAPFWQQKGGVHIVSIFFSSVGIGRCSIWHHCWTNHDYTSQVVWPEEEVKSCGNQTPQKNPLSIRGTGGFILFVLMDLLFLLPTGIISYAIFLCNILNIFFKVFCALRVFYTSKSPTFLENPRTFRHKKTPENQKFPRFW